MTEAGAKDFLGLEEGRKEGNRGVRFSRGRG
jgi:hypothetical protein